MFLNLDQGQYQDQVSRIQRIDLSDIIPRTKAHFVIENPLLRIFENQDSIKTIMQTSIQKENLTKTNRSPRKKQILRCRIKQNNI